MPLHLDAWELTCAEFGIPFERQQLYQYGGIPTRKIIAMLAEQQGLTVGCRGLYRRKIALYMNISTRSASFPRCGAGQALSRQGEDGDWHGSPRNQADSIMKSTDSTPISRLVVSADDVTNHTAAP